MKVINRIKDNEEFGITVKKGQVLKHSPFIIHYLKNDKNVCRIGLSVGKKVGNAVIRNRVKRQTRAMCDSLVEYTSHTFDIVIIVRPDFIKGSFDDNKKVLNDLLSKIGITKWKEEWK